MLPFHMTRVNLWNWAQRAYPFGFQLLKKKVNDKASEDA